MYSHVTSVPSQAPSEIARSIVGERQIQKSTDNDGGNEEFIQHSKRAEGVLAVESPQTCAEYEVLLGDHELTIPFPPFHCSLLCEGLFVARQLVARELNPEYKRHVQRRQGIRFDLTIDEFTV